MNFVLKNFETELSVSRIANIHYFEFTQDFETQDDRHPFAELVYVDSGSLKVHSQNFSGILTQSQMILHSADEMHSLTCLPGTAPDVIIIGYECRNGTSENDSAELLEEFSKAPVTLSAELSKLLAEIVKEGRAVFLPPYDIPFIEDMKKRPDCLFGADQLLKNSLEIFLLKLIRESRFRISDEQRRDSFSPFVSEIAGYLRQNIREKFTIDELAFLFGTNRSTLCKTFKAETGSSVVEFVNRERIRIAKQMIREGGRNFTEISEELNFPTQAYFTRLFQRISGLSPREYIKTIKSKLE